MGAESARKPYFKPFFGGVQIDTENFSGVQRRVLYSRNDRKAASDGLTAKKRLTEFIVCDNDFLTSALRSIAVHQPFYLHGADVKILV